jgi:hypothetical protein
MKIKKNKAFNICFSDIDYEHLQILASNENMKPSEYIRTLIQIMYIEKGLAKARNLENVSRELKLNKEQK